MAYSIKKSSINPDKTIIVEFGREKIADVTEKNEVVIFSKLTHMQDFRLRGFCKKHGLKIAPPIGHH